MERSEFLRRIRALQDEFVILNKEGLLSIDEVSVLLESPERLEEIACSGSWVVHEIPAAAWQSDSCYMISAYVNGINYDVIVTETELDALDLPVTNGAVVASG